MARQTEWVEIELPESMKCPRCGASQLYIDHATSMCGRCQGRFRLAFTPDPPSEDKDGATQSHERALELYRNYKSWYYAEHAAANRLDAALTVAQNTITDLEGELALARTAIAEQCRKLAEPASEVPFAKGVYYRRGRAGSWELRESDGKPLMSLPETSSNLAKVKFANKAINEAINDRKAIAEQCRKLGERTSEGAFAKAGKNDACNLIIPNRGCWTLETKDHHDTLLAAINDAINARKPVVDWELVGGAPRLTIDGQMFLMQYGYHARAIVAALVKGGCKEATT